MMSSHIHFLHLEPEDELTVDFIEATGFEGVSEYDGDEAVAQLEETDFKRLSLIANVIDVGIARTILLNNRADFYKMFNIEPEAEATERRFLSRHLHLGKLFGFTD